MTDRDNEISKRCEAATQEILSIHQEMLDICLGDYSDRDSAWFTTWITEWFNAIKQHWPFDDIPYLLDRVVELEKEIERLNGLKEAYINDYERKIAIKDEKIKTLEQRVEEWREEYKDIEAKIERLREAQRWIPEKERLPELVCDDSSSDCLIAIRYKYDLINEMSTICVGYTLDGEWWAYMDHDCHEISGGDKVTHWRSMPEPPKEEV